MKPIVTVDDALAALTYLSGWVVPLPALAVATTAIDSGDMLNACYADALKRTEGLVLSRARLLRAWDVLNAHGVLR